MKMLDNVEKEKIIDTLKARFENNISRHTNVKWENLLKKLIDLPEKMWSLNEMEKTGGEPDVVKYDEDNNEYIFYDCSKESPAGRRSICYDNEALESRDKFKPQDSALNMANKIGIQILDEEEYRYLQSLEEFDLKTSNWIKTPDEVRKLGGAIFCDRRYNRVFTYHNGAESYYNVRGFRGVLKV